MATNPHTLSEVDRLHWLITHNEGQRVQLGGYRFWVNPERITDLREWLYTEIPVVGGGYVINDFGAKPYQFTLMGSTGTMGEFDIDDKTGIAGTRPQFNTPNRMTTLSIPGRGKWDCRVISVENDVTSNEPFFYYFIIQLKVYPDHKPSYQKIASLTSMANGITGPFGQAKAAGIPANGWKAS